MAEFLEKEILILDGGLGTTLEDEHNVKFDSNTPLWSSHLLISDPATLETVQRDFVTAGADILLTPTYQVSDYGFRKTGIAKPYPYLEAALEISKRASNGRAMVALSMGAYGAIMQPSQEYSGKYDITEADLVTFHSQRLASFNSDKFQLIAFETIPRLDEVKAVKEAYHGLKPYWISCVFPNEDRLPDGTAIQDLLPVMLEGVKPWAIGMNCTKVHKVADLVIKFEHAAETLNLDLPRLVIYPDGTNGLQYDTTLQRWVGEEEEGPAWDEQLVEIVKDVRQRSKWKGIVVGGCCKTSPKHIAKLRQRIDELMG